jgi:hypothetical protein
MKPHLQQMYKAKLYTITASLGPTKQMSWGGLATDFVCFEIFVQNWAVFIGASVFLRGSALSLRRRSSAQLVFRLLMNEAKLYLRL